MNKSQIVLAAIGGVVVVGALVLGYFIWDASSVKAERAETLEGDIASAGGVMKKLPLKPAPAELKVYADGVAAYGEWQAEARKVAARGDLVFENTTPAEFKTTIVGEARKIAGLPGCFDGKFVKSDFGFGFKDYVLGGAMPPAADLKRLQREWNDVTTVLRTIAECGGAEAGVVELTMGKAKLAQAATQPAESEKSKKKGKKKNKAKAVADEGPSAAAEGSQLTTSFTVTFMARPSALVKTVNAFATGTRFIVVEDFSFVRERDEIAERLGGDAKKSESSGTSRRRRRSAQPEEKAVETKGGSVTDPATAPLLKVTMALAVHDFGSLEDEAKGEAKDAVEGKGDEK